MWFGTWNGLNRYDGYSFRAYKREDKSQSISNNFIHAICEDKQGNLWIGTRNGLNLFDFRQERFINFFHDSLDENSLSGNWINALHCDTEGNIWAGTNGSGLNKIRYNPESKEFRFEHFTKSGRNSLQLPDDLINSIYSDSRNRLWIGTNIGLTLFDKAADSSIIFRNIPSVNNSLTSDEILCTFEDKEGIVWVGTRFGLNRWTGEGEIFVRYDNTADENSVSHSTINAIGEDPIGRLYIASLGGVDLYERSRDIFVNFPVYGREGLSLNNEFINSLWCDRSGIIWIGTEKGGVNKYNIYQKQFRYYSAESGDIIQLNHNTVNSILEEGDIIWVGTAGGGLNKINTKNKRVKYFSFDARQSNSIGNDFITSLCRDHSNNLWIGTWGGGFCRLISEEKNGSFQFFQNDPDEINSLINDFVSTIYEDRDGNVWIGTEGGLELYNPITNTFTHILNREDSGEPISEVGSILRDKNRNLWIGTRNGLFCVSRDQLESITKNSHMVSTYCFKNDPNNDFSLNENYVVSLYEDSKGSLWIGTYGNGLNKLEWENNDFGSIKFSHYTQDDGLSNNVVYGILEDSKQNLWLSTDYGLSKFNPVEGEFSNYFVADGLQSNQFYWSAFAKGETGTLYFGGMKGLNFFHPEQIMNNKIPPAPILTDFKIFNNSIEPGETFGKRVILEKTIFETEKIELSYRENTFSFEFSGLSYNLPEKNMYEYKLEGIDKDWVRVNANRRFASYTKLPGGEYVFKLRAANNDGLWNDTPLALKINIRPPFWKTNWFRMLIGLLLIILIVGYMRLHTRSLQIQKRKLEQQVRARTKQIEDQNIKLELQNTEILEQRDRLLHLNKKVKAANQLKLKFFTNISHEFRTPLTLILGPLEKLRQGWKAEDDTKQTLNLIIRNAERLLHLINQLMDFRKIEKGKMNLHVQEGNLDEFVQAIIQAFKDLEIQKKIELEYIFNGDEKPIWFDHEKLENIFFNLLSNAFKYTPPQGSIRIHVKYTDHMKGERASREEYENGLLPYIEIEVADTGKGINKEKLPNIFRRFYQAEQVSDGNAGSGIGLSLTRDLVKVHKGNISVKSEPGKGTVFTIQIPCRRIAYSDEETTQTKLDSTDLKSHVDNLAHILKTEQFNEIETSPINLKKHVGKPTLLIVEDNFELREFIAKRLNKSFNIILAENGEIALGRAIEHNPELIVSDIMMPVMNGLDLCKAVKQNIDTSHIPIILLTARDSAENKIEGYKTGADDYIPKPFNIELLETRIQNLIESRISLRRLFRNKGQVDPTEITESPTDQKFLREALEHIERNIDNTEFNVNDFASVMCVSRSLLHKKLTALTDQSATDFINTVRLKKSKELMTNGSYNISEVAYAVGYNDPKYFSRLFKKHFELSPSEYIKELGIKAG